MISNILVQICYYDQWWMRDQRIKNINKCETCHKKIKYENDLLKKMKQNPSLLVKFDIDENSCMESYPCQHSIVYHIQDANLSVDDQIVKITSCLDGVEINKFYRTMNMEIPPHFREYGDGFYE